MAESILRPYQEDISRLYFEERNSQADIIKYLEQSHGFRVTPSTLSRFIKTLPVPEETKKGPNVSPDEERFLQDAELWQRLQASLNDLMGQHDRLHARLEVVEDAQDRRQRTLEAALRDLQARPSASDGVSPLMLERIEKSQRTVEERLNALSVQGIDPAVLWQIQKKTALVTAISLVVVAVVGLLIFQYGIVYHLR